MYIYYVIYKYLYYLEVITSVSEWKYIIASAFKFKLLHQPALPIMGVAQASWMETNGAWWINFQLVLLHQPALTIIGRLTLKGRGYFTNGKDWGGGIMAPQVISARSNVKRLIFSGY